MVQVDPAGAVLVAGALLLLAAAPGHLRHPAVFEAGMRRHGVLPRRAIRWTRLLLPWTELALGASTLLAWGARAVDATVARSGALVVTGGLTATLYVAFALYSTLAVRGAPGTPCACFGGGEALTWLVPVRALVVAAGTAVAVARPASSPVGAASAAATISAGAIVALLAWAVPTVVALLRRPENEPGHDRR